MTEKDKAARGMLYLPDTDKELSEERLRAKDLCYDLNMLRPSDVERRQEILKRLLGSMGENCFVVQPFYCDYGYNIKAGDNFFANHNTVVLDGAQVSFGNNVYVAPNCGFYTAGHPIEAEQRNKGLEYAYPITVGDNVWIGAGVHVMPGVSIGSNVVIGGGSVVVKDIPDDCVAAGNPCRVIRKIKN